jgi:hypothetical protein
MLSLALCYCTTLVGLETGEGENELDGFGLHLITYITSLILDPNNSGLTISELNQIL